MILSDSSFLDSFDHQRACRLLPLLTNLLLINIKRRKLEHMQIVTSHQEGKKNTLKPAKNERFTPPNNRDGHLDKLIKGV